MNTRPVVIGNHADFFRDGDLQHKVVATVSRARATNVATLVTAAHGLTTGDTVDIVGLAVSSYNATGKVVTVINSTTFTYASTGIDETTTPDTGGTVTHTLPAAGREVLPADTDANWISFGKIESLDTEKKQTEDEVYAPNPGRIELYDVIEVKRILGYDFTANELTPFAVETLFGTGALDGSSTDYAQLSGSEKKGWLRVKQYDQDNALVNTVWSYCYLKVNGKVTFGDKHVTVPFSTRQLISTKNKGALA